MLQFKGDSPREFNRLAREFSLRLEPFVRLVVKDLNEFAEDHRRSGIGRSLTVTSVCRSIEENRRVGGSPTSAHLDTPDGRRAVDLRSLDLTPKEKATILAYLKHRWGGLLYVEASKHGTAEHIHINLLWQHAPANFKPE